MHSRVIIDYWLQFDEGRAAEVAAFHAPYAGAGARVTHVAPKPSPWQGRHALTAVPHFCASAARNTAFVHCATPYIACVDDLTVLRPGWLDAVLWGKRAGAVLLGSYAKVRGLSADAAGGFAYASSQGRLEDEPGLDPRHGQVSTDDPVRVAGSWLYGCSFALPLSVALAVDGFDEMCDGQGGEDSDFGIRVGRATPHVFFCRRMFTFESDDPLPAELTFVRTAKRLGPGTAMPAKLGLMSDHAAIQWVVESGSTAPFLRSHLAEDRAAAAAGLQPLVRFDAGFRDWRDGAPLAQMRA